MAEYELNGQVFKSKRAYQNALVNSNLNEEGIRVTVDLVGKAFESLKARYPDKTDKQINSIIYLGYKDSIEGKVSYTLKDALANIPNRGRVYLVAFNFVVGGAIRVQASEVVKIKYLNDEVVSRAKTKLEDETETPLTEPQAPKDIYQPKSLISADITSVDKN